MKRYGGSGSGVPADSLRSTLYGRYRSRFVAQRSTTSSEGTYEWKRRVFLPLLQGLPASSTIVELGCGSGELLALIQTEGYPGARGVDRSEEQVRAARERGANAELGDAIAYMSEIDESVDCVIAVDFLEHLSKDELSVLMPLIWKSLVPGGRLIVQTVNAAGVNGARVAYGDLTHETLFTETSIAQLLRGFGFDGLEVFEAGPRSIGVRGVVRVGLWRTFRLYPRLVSYIESGIHQRIWTENLIALAWKSEA